MAGQLTLAARREAIASFGAAMTGIGDVLWQGQGQDLGEVFRELDDAARLLEAARVAVLSEAKDRGETTRSLAGAGVGWVLQWAPGLGPGGAKLLHDVVVGTSAPLARPLREAVVDGRVSVRNASVVLAEMDRLETRLTQQARPTVWAGLVAIAESGGPRQIRALRPALLAEYGRVGELQQIQDRARRRVGLSQPWDDGDGLFEYRLRLDVEAKAVLEAALSPLAAPRPADGRPDLRGSDRRRGEALVEIVRRGVAAADGVPASAKTQLLLSMDLDQLRAGLGAAATLGGPDAGTLLAPGTVRRLACDAAIIPVLLGGPSQVLDLGHTTRCFTPAQTKALWLRDGGCTLPGCTMPAQWCDAHHLTHWLDGGPTDLANAALLCGYHHHLVHDRRLAGHLTPHGSITWDLTAGSYDHHLTRPPRPPSRE